MPGQGPAPDILHFREALDQAWQRVRIVALAADAGYDSEASHEYARQQLGIRSLIPPLIGRRTEKPPAGYWRRHMKGRLHNTRYSSRWQVETVNSMLKRLLDSALRARKRWTQNREIVLRSLTLNLMILRRRRVFYRAGRESTFGPAQLVRECPPRPEGRRRIDATPSVSCRVGLSGRAVDAAKSFICRARVGESR